MFTLFNHRSHELEFQVCVDYHSTLEGLAQIIFFLKMLKFSKNISLEEKLFFVKENEKSFGRFKEYLIYLINACYIYPCTMVIYK
jgi:hypothetical protein